MRPRSIVVRTDGYSPSHPPVYPEKTEGMYSYLESRGAPFPEIVFNGLSPIIQKFFVPRVTIEDVNYADMRFAKYYGTREVFAKVRPAWEHIVYNLEGRLPLRIKAVPEGLPIPPRNILASFESTDPLAWFLPDWCESVLHKVWYPTTVATLSREIKKVILAALVKSGDPAGLPWKLHDFGYRGVSSEESAEIGGGAHAFIFRGSDTYIANEYLTDFYGADMATATIPATQHSIMAAKGPDGEFGQMDRFLEVFGPGPYVAIACVSDTFNLWRAVKDGWGGELKAKVTSLPGGKVLVVRPDSGDPPTIVQQLAETLDAAFGHTVNAKGYKVLNYVRMIQGDGVNLDSIRACLDALEVRKYSADNIAFGMGGALLQQVHRDNFRFKIAASSYVINGRREDHMKDPITDAGKRSKPGRLKLIRDDGVYATVPLDQPSGPDILQTVYENGVHLIKPTYDEVVQRAELLVPEAAEAWALP